MSKPPTPRQGPMHGPDHTPTTRQQATSITPATSAARYPVGPSKGRPHGGSSAPGVAEEDGHPRVLEEEQPSAAPAVPLSRAADAAALHRVARRRKRMTEQRRERVDVRYSAGEKAAIVAKARSLNIAAAHYVGALVTAHVHGALALPGQRTEVDDYIDELAALRRQVAKIGHLVNQVARKLNSGGPPHAGDTATLAHAERTLHAVETAVQTIATSANHAVARKTAR